MPSGNAPNALNDANENAPNEPTEPENNATNQPRRAADGEDGMGVGLGASTMGGGHAYLEGEHETEKANKQFWREVEARKQIRAERLRKLNEESRLEAEAAWAARHSPYRQIRKKNGKPGGQRPAEKLCPQQRSDGENAGYFETDLEQLVKAAFGPSERAGPSSL